MSWLFGKKKNKESTNDNAEEPATTSSEDYIIIERQENLLEINTEKLNIPTPPKSIMTQENILADTQTYLNSIGFKLNPSFEKSDEIERIKIDEILSFILRITSERYEYDFSVEENAIAEMQSA